MNKVFKIIWNSTLGRLVVASEAARSKVKSSGQELQAVPTVAVKVSPAGVLRPLVVAIGVAGVGAAIPAAIAEDATYDNLTVNNTAILSALQVSGAASFSGLTVGGVNVASAINANEGGVTALGNEISGLDARVGDNETDITGLGNDVSGLDIRVGDNETAITGLGNDISGLDTRVGDNETAITGLGNDVSGLDTRVGDNETAITGLGNDISGLDTRVGGNETAITGLGNDISGLDTRVGDNETAITGLGGDVSGLDTRVGDNETAITGLGNDISGLDTRVGDNETAITGLGGDVSGLDTRVGDNETAITGLGNDISGLDTRVGDNETAITAVENSVNAGWNATDGNSSSNIGPNGKVTFDGDSNVTVTESGIDDDAKIQVALSDDITVDSVITGNSTLNNDGLTVSDGAGNITMVTAAGTSVTNGTDSTEYGANGMTIAGGGPSVTTSGIDAGDQKITGVSAGNISDGSKDAVTGGQLFDLEEGLFTDGDGIKYFHANSIEADSQANGTDSVAIGPTSVADGNSSFAAGFGATTSDVADNGIALGTQASAGAGNSLAVGNQANAALESGTAIGNQAQAKAENSIALGKQTLALGENATSIGATGDPIATLDLAVDGTDLTSINGVPVTATGTPLNSDGTYTPGGSGQITEIAGVAVDEDGVNQFISALKAGANLASGTNSVSLGVGTIAAGDSSVAIGDSVNAAVDAVGIGKGARAAGSAVGIGPGATASGANSFAGGNNATASGANSFAAGAGAQAGGAVSIALGKGAVAAATNNISIGEEAGVGTDPVIADDQVNNIAIGAQAGQSVAGQRNVAMGSSAGSAAEGNDNIAFGSAAGNSLMGDSNISIGLNANSVGGGSQNRAVGIGEDASAGTDGVAIGHEAVASGSNGLALGTGAATSGAGVALGENAAAGAGYVALGSGSQATQSDVGGSSYLTNRGFSGSAVSVGNGETGLTRRIVNVEDGAQDTDAVNVRQLKYAVNNVNLLDPDFADGVILDLQDQIDQNLLSYVSIEDGGTDRNNKDNSGALGVRSLAIGPDASTSAGADDATAIGSSVSVEGASSVVLGHDVQALKDNAVVIGSKQTEARDESGVAIGMDSQSRGTNSIVIGTRSESDDQDGTNVQNSIVIGTDSQSTAREGIVIGRDSLVNAERAMAQGDNAEATADDAMAVGTGSRASGVSAQASGTRASASGANAQASGTGASASGTSAQASGTRAQASGTNAQASGTDASASGVSAQASGTRASASGANAIASGTDARGYASNGIAMGTGAQAGFDDPSNLDPQRNIAGIAIGNQAVADEEHALALGVGAQSQSQSATAIGDGAEATATAQDGLAVGSGARVTAQNAAAFGQSAEAVAGEALAMGSGARAAAQSATAIGDGAQANHQGSVALGNNAVTAAPIPTTAMTVDKNTYDFAGTSPVATVSVGTAGAERTLTNVAAGRVSATSTDAINGSQLYGTNQAVNALADNLDTAGGSVADVLGGNAVYDPQTHQVTMNNVGGTGEDTVNDAIEYAAQGWNISANSALGANVAPGGSVDFSDTDGNIEISRSGTNLTFALNETLDLGAAGSITTGNSVMNDGGVTISGGPNNDVTLTGSGLNNGGNTITGVADGVAGTDAVNVSQLTAQDTALTNKGLDFAPNDGGTVHRNLGQTLDIQGGATTAGNYSDANIKTIATANGINIQLADNPVFTSIAAGDSTLDSSGLAITGGPSVTKSGIDAAGNQIANVAAGTAGTDAVNVSQLNTAAAAATTEVQAGTNVADVTQSTGGDGQAIYTVNAKGASVSAGSGDVSVSPTGPDANNVTDYAVDLSTTTKDNISQGVAAKTAVDTTGLTFDGDSGSSSVRKLGDTVAITGDSNITTTGAGTGVGIALNETLDLGAAGSITTGNSVMNDGGVTISGGPNNDVTLTGSGLNNGGNTITGVADGVAGTDAVNVSQLTAQDTALTNKGLDFAPNDGGTVHRNLGQTLDIQGGATTAGNYSDANIKTIATANGINIQLADNPVFTSIAAGDSTLDSSGLAITGGPSVTKSGIDAAGNQIANVAAGTAGTDAVNVSQLDSATAAATTEVQAGTNVADVTQSTGGDGQAIYTVNAKGASVSAGSGDVSVSPTGPDANNVTDYAVDLSTTTKDNISQGVAAKTAVDTTGLTFDGDSGSSSARRLGDSVAITGDSNITTTGAGTGVGIALNETLDLGAAGSVTTGNSVMNNGGLTISGGPNNDVTLTGSGLNNGGNTITGVADGAVNAVSGDAINGSQLQAAGDSLASNVLGGNADYTGNDFTMSDVGGTGENTIDDAIRSANTTANAGWNVADANGNSNNIGPNGKVTFDGDSNVTVTESGADDDAKVQVALNDDIAVDSVTTGNSTLDNDGLSVTDGTDSTEYGADGMVIAGGPSVTAGGIDAGDLKITGVADGDINASSGDAINGSQLQAAGDSLASNVLGGNADYTGNDFTMSDVGGTGEDTIDDAIRSANTAATAGWDISAQGSNPTNVGPGDSVDLNNSDGNIVVSKNATDNDVTFDLADNLTADSVTTGNSTLDTNGLTVDDGAGNVTEVTTAGTRVTDGTDSTEYGADGMTVAGGPSVTAGGIDAGDLKITGVADGDINASSGDAINGSQLQAAGDSLASNVLGGNADYTGNDFTMSDVGGTGEDTIDDAIRSANTTANAGWNVADTNGNSNNIGPNGKVTFDGDSNVTVTESGVDDDAKVQVALNDDIAVDSVTTGNSTLDNDGLTVTDGSGNITEVTTAGTRVTDGTDSTEYGADGMTIAGGPSVTAGGIDAAGNKVTNVADGDINASSGDAINGSQLQAAGDSLASNVLGGNADYTGNDFTMSDVGGTGEDTIDDAIESANTAANAGWNVADANGNSHNIGPNGKVTFDGDSNVTVTESGADDDAKVQVALNDDIAVDSVTTGNSTLDNDGLTVADGAGNITDVTASGTSVADGTNSTEYGADGMTIAGGPSVTAGGIDAGDLKITGVADGDINASSGDAINGSQLQAAGDSLASNVLGGNADYTGNDFTMSDVGGTGENTIDDAIESANTTANAGWNVADANGNSNNIGPNGKVTFDGDSNVTVTESGVDDDAKVQVALNDDIAVDSVTTGNSTLDNDGLTVTDGSGNITDVTATGTSVANGTDSTEYGADGMTIAGGPSVTTSGIDAAGNKVTNVADGDVNSTSSDAINGSQLQAAGDSLASNVLGGNADYTGNDFTMSDVGGTGESTIDDAIKSANNAANAGWNVADANGNSHNIGPNGKVTFDGDSNVTVTESGVDDDAKVQVALNDDIAVDSVTTGNSTLDNDGLTVADGAGNVTEVTTAGTSVTDGTNSTEYGADGMTIAGGPSVTAGGIDAGDLKITGVADGDINASSGDAINGSQLQAAGDSLASNVLGGNADYTGNDFTMSDVGGTGENTIDDAIRSANTTANAGWNVADTNGNSNNIGPNGKVTFDGDSNVTVTESGSDDDAKVQVALNDDIAVDSVTTGNSTLDNDGLTVADGVGNITDVTASGTSVADGAGNITEVTTAGTRVADGTNSTEYGADGMTIAGGPSVTAGGIDAAGNKVTNVADGDINASSGDAINGSQLQAAGDSLASNVLGGNADYTGNDFTMSDVGGTGENTIDDAIRSANTTANAGWNVADTNGNSNNIGPNGKVTFDGDSNVTVTESGADDDAKVQVALNDDIAVDSVTTGNSTLDNDGLTVADGAGNITDVTASGTSVADGTDSTEYGADGMAITGGPSVTAGGIDAGDLKITGVADGDINASSGDAINGSQLQAAGDSLASNVLGGNADYTGNDFTMSDVGGTGENTIDDAIESANTAANAGWNVADTNGNSNNIGPNGKVTFDGDSNVTVTESGADDDAKVQVALNDDIAVDSVTADSVTTGNSSLDNDGLTVADGAGNITDVTASGTSVADGTNSTEYGADGMTIAGGPSVTAGGIDAGDLKITGVADGDINASSGDAINGSQLQAAGDSLASNVLGGNADYTGNDFTMSDVGGTGEDTIDDAIRSANTTANAGWNVADANGNSNNIGPNGKVTFDGDSNVTVTESGVDDDAKVQVALNDDIAVDSVTTGNSTLDNDGLTVTDGSGNITDVTATGTSVANGTDSTEYGADGMTIAGGPSVTTSGIDAAGNKVTNVADGDVNSTSSDAINGSQLQAAGDSLASNVLGGNADYTGNDFTMSDVGGTGENTIDDAIESANTAANAGWNVADTNGNSNNIGPNGKVTFDGDSNVTVTESGVDDDAKVQVALNDDITVDSVTADSVTTGNSTLDTDGLTVADGAGNVTKVTTAGTSVTDGTDSTEYGADGMTIAGGPSVTTSGIDAAGNKITNVADGDINASSGDAINGSQLQAAGDSLASNVLGGNAAYTGNDFTMSDVGGTGENTIDDAIRSANTTANAGWDISAQGSNPTNVGPGDSVDLNNSDGNIEVSKTAADNNVTFDLAANLTADSLTTGNSTLDTSGLSVDDGAGNVTKVTTAGTSVTDGTNSTEYGADGMTIAGGPSVTTSGIDAAGNTVTGVADGAINSTSSDAINGSQLQAAGDSLASNVLGGNAAYTGNDFTMSDVGGTGENTIDDAIRSANTAATAGWNVADTNGNSHNIGPNGKVTFEGDSNVTVTESGVDDDAKVQVALNDDIIVDSVTADSVTTGDSRLDTDGLTVADGAGNVTKVTTAGTSVTDGTDSTEYGADGMTIAGGPSVTAGGIDAAGNKITNVADGDINATSSDAINGSQLQAAGDSLASNVLGGNAAYTGNDFTMSDVGGTGENTIDDAIRSANTAATAGWDISAQGNNPTNVGPGDSVDLNNSDGNIMVSKTATDNDVTFDLADDIDVASVTADDGAGNVTEVTATGTSVTDGTDSTEYGADGMTIAGGPSVTSGGIDAGDLKITGVADGDVNATSSDAINGSQLQAAGDSLASNVLGGNADYTGNDFTMSDVGGTGENTIDDAIRSANTTANAGWNVADANGNSHNIGPNGKVTFDGDSNVTVTESGVDDDAKVQVALNDDIAVESVTTGNSTLDTDGLTVDDGAGNVTEVTATGTSVTDGTDSTEYGADGMIIAGGPSVTSGGIDAGDLKITSVADGDVNATSSDAINGSQLQAAGDSLASNVLGGNADYTGNDFTMSDVGGTGENTIDDAIRSANTTANAGWDISAQGSNPTNVGPGDSVDLNNSDGNIEVSKTAADNNVTFDLAANLTADSLTTGNSTLDTSGLSVDDGAGNVTKVTTAGTSVTDGTNSTEYGADGMTIAGGPSVTTSGIDAAGNTVTGVADGAINSTSSDAINGSQLQAAGDSLASNVLGGNAAYTGNDFTMSDVGGTGENTIDDAIRSANTAATAGWNVADTNGNSHNIGPNGKVTFEGDSNVTVTESGVDDDAKVQVALNDDIIVDSVTADSVTTGDSRLDTDGLTVADGAGNVTKVTTAGTSVTDGTDSTEYGADGMTIAGGPSVTAGGIDAAGNKITNVADGDINATSSDAINGSQLQAAGDSLASNVLGGNAAYTGNDFTMSDVGGTGENTIDDAIRSANTAATAGWDISAQGNNPTNVGPGDSVDLNNSDGNIEVSKTAADNNVTFDLAANLTADSLTTGNSTLDTDGLTIADGAGNVTKVTTAGTSVTDGAGNSTEYGADGMTIAGGPSVTSGGIDAADKKITGVKAGTDATDAVNVSQLDDTESDLITQGMNFAGDSGGDVHRDLGQTLDIVGGADASGNTNITTVADNASGQLSIVMSDQPQFGNVTVNTSGSDTIDGLGNTTFDPNNVVDDRAATEGQLGDVNKVASAGWNVADVNGNSHNIGPNGKVTFEGDSNVTVKESGSDDDANIRVTLSDDITVDSVTLGSSGPKFSDDGSGNIEVSDDIGDPVKITNVADGDISSGSKDAINGGQLWTTQQNIKKLEKNQVHYYSVNDGGAQGGNYDNDGATASNAIAAGVNAEATSVDSIALGSGAQAGDAHSVALGSDAKTARSQGTESIEINGMTYDFAGTSPIGTVSIGSADTNRTITNVAAGRISKTSTDAINGSQLYATNQAVGAVGDEVKDLDRNIDDLGNRVTTVEGDVSQIDNRVSSVEGDVINIDGRVTHVEGDVNTLQGDVASLGDNIGKLDDQAVKYDTNSDGSVDYDSISLGGSDGTTITNVADGDIAQGSSDAVNGGQLYSVKEEIGDINTSLDGGMDFAADEGEALNRKLGDTVAITGDDNITTRTSGEGVEVTLNQELNVDSVTTGKTTVSNEGVTIEDGPSMTTDGIDGGGMRITNVAPGVDATDAVNVGQMQELSQRFAQEINSVHGRINDVEDSANAGTASALAAATVPQAWMPGKSMVGVGAGTYQGESAVSVGVSRLSDNGRWVIQGKVTGDSQSNFGAGIGAGWHW